MPIKTEGVAAILPTLLLLFNCLLGVQTACYLNSCRTHVALGVSTNATEEGRGACRHCTLQSVCEGFSLFTVLQAPPAVQTQQHQGTAQMSFTFPQRSMFRQKTTPCMCMTVHAPKLAGKQEHSPVWSRYKALHMMCMRLSHVLQQ
jgi:hypothetical protein